ncbi:MAG: gliding motility lipoprotein GldH [Haliscomenobacter sp.]|nr:gliding motility lipoprotein GldH [Haliscomenobacter sp.]MBK7474934.1 gliding motility lipoprotein GldH [Haliscomenobacter sp.]MBK8880474.1 gliding motility lipoprotein GldH [Haliscomenobacter sp.]
MRKPFALAFFLAFLASACGPRYLLKETRQLEGETWSYADSLSFQAAIRDTARIYDISLLVKHQTSFHFQNLYLRIHTGFPDGKKLTQVLSLELANKAGKWQGACRGDHCTLEVPIQLNAFFNQTGVHTFTLEQYMRADDLPGISALGIRIKEAGSRK